MSLAKFESEVKIVPQNQNILFSRFNDLNSLSAIKDRMNDPEVQQKLSEQVPADKLADVQKYAEGLSFEADAIHIASPMGNITLRVVERDVYPFMAHTLRNRGNGIAQLYEKAHVTVAQIVDADHLCSGKGAPAPHLVI